MLGLSTKIVINEKALGFPSRTLGDWEPRTVSTPWFEATKPRSFRVESVLGMTLNCIHTE